MKNQYLVIFILMAFSIDLSAKENGVVYQPTQADYKVG